MFDDIDKITRRDSKKLYKKHKKYFKEIWAKKTGEKIKIYGKQLKLF